MIGTQNTPYCHFCCCNSFKKWSIKKCAIFQPTDTVGGNFFYATFIFWRARMERISLEVSLKNLSKIVVDKIKGARVSTPREIANSIINNLSSRSESQTFAKSLNRRIYDVINVLTALGFVEKDEKSIKWIDNPSLIQKNQDNDPLVAKTENRVLEKEEKLRYKVRLLLLYKCLIESNKTQTTNKGTHIPIPLMIICFKTPNYTINFFENNHTIDIRSTSEPTLITPLELMSMKKFPVKLIRHVISCSPEIVSCKQYLPFSDESEDPEALVSF